MKKNVSVFLAVAGVLLAALGGCLLLFADPAPGLEVLSYVLIGLGCGAFGHGMGEWLRIRKEENDPAAAKQLDIEARDERNLALSQRAKAKAFDVGHYVFAGLVVVFSLLRVALPAMLLLLAAYLILVGLSLYFYHHYEKKM